MNVPQGYRRLNALSACIQLVIAHQPIWVRYNNGPLVKISNPDWRPTPDANFEYFTEEKGPQVVIKGIAELLHDLLKDTTGSRPLDDLIRSMLGGTNPPTPSKPSWADQVTEVTREEAIAQGGFVDCALNSGLVHWEDEPDYATAIGSEEEEDVCYFYYVRKRDIPSWANEVTEISIEEALRGDHYYALTFPDSRWGHRPDEDYRARRCEWNFNHTKYFFYKLK